MKLTSREVTYTTVVEQLFFDDESELIICTGWPEGGGGDYDIKLEWVGNKPEWADNLTEQELWELRTEGQE